MQAFENLIQQVAAHQKEAGELMNSEDVMVLFRPLISDTSIEIETRLKALTLLEQVVTQKYLSTFCWFSKILSDLICYQIVFPYGQVVRLSGFYPAAWVQFPLRMSLYEGTHGEM